MLNRTHIWGALLVILISAAGLRATVSKPAPVSEAPSALVTRLAAWQDLTRRERDYHLTEDLTWWANVHRRQALGTYAQKHCLAQAIYYEARSESLAGQKAVAEVVMNRVKTWRFPDTVCGVVYQGAQRHSGCQFSFTCDGSMDRAPFGAHWTRAQDIAGLVFTEGLTPVTKRATHYHTTAVSPYWSKKLKKTNQYGTHVFYRFKTRKELREGASTISLAPPPS